MVVLTEAIEAGRSGDGLDEYLGLRYEDFPLTGSGGNGRKGRGAIMVSGSARLR